MRQLWISKTSRHSDYELMLCLQSHNAKNTVSITANFMFLKFAPTVLFSYYLRPEATE